MQPRPRFPCLVDALALLRFPLMREKGMLAGDNPRCPRMGCAPATPPRIKLALLRFPPKESRGGWGDTAHGPPRMALRGPQDAAAPPLHLPCTALALLRLAFSRGTVLNRVVGDRGAGSGSTARGTRCDGGGLAPAGGCLPGLVHLALQGGEVAVVVDHAGRQPLSPFRVCGGREPAFGLGGFDTAVAQAL